MAEVEGAVGLESRAGDGEVGGVGGRSVGFEVGDAGEVGGVVGGGACDEEGAGGVGCGEGGEGGGEGAGGEGGEGGAGGGCEGELAGEGEGEGEGFCSEVVEDKLAGGAEGGEGLWGKLGVVGEDLEAGGLGGVVAGQRDGVLGYVSV